MDVYAIFSFGKFCYMLHLHVISCRTLNVFSLFFAAGAMGTKYLCTRGYPTRWARIRVWVCARGRGHGYDSKPNGYFITGLKI